MKKLELEEVDIVSLLSSLQNDAERLVIMGRNPGDRSIVYREADTTKTTTFGEVCLRNSADLMKLREKIKLQVESQNTKPTTSKESK